MRQEDVVRMSNVLLCVVIIIMTTVTDMKTLDANSLAVARNIFCQGTSVGFRRIFYIFLVAITYNNH